MPSSPYQARRAAQSPARRPRVVLPAAPPTLLAAAERQRWLLTTEQLHAAKVSSSGISRALKAGWLTRLFHGVYLVGRRVPTTEELDRAGLLASGHGAVLGYRSAARVHKLMTWVGPVEVVVPHVRRKQPGLHPRSSALTSDEVTVVGGVPVTTVAATLCDLATVLSPAALAQVVHEAEYRNKLAVTEVERLLALHPRRPGCGVLRELITLRRPIVGSLNRGLERRFHRFLAERGYPPTEHNVPFVIAGVQISVDVLFRIEWLAVEIDGDVHKSARNFESDRRRDRRLLVELGLRVIRVTAADLDRPDELDADLRAALARRS